MEALAAGIRHFRQFLTDLFDVFRRHFDRNEVRFREVTVVTVPFFDTLEDGNAFGFIPATRSLLDGAAFVENLRLTDGFVFNALLDGAEGVDVLDFRLSP